MEPVCVVVLVPSKYSNLKSFWYRPHHSEFGECLANVSNDKLGGIFTDLDAEKLIFTSPEISLTALSTTVLIAVAQFALLTYRCVGVTAVQLPHVRYGDVVGETSTSTKFNGTKLPRESVL